MMRQKYLREVWRFEDLHKEDEAPTYIHRVKGHEIKHIQTIGDEILIVNSADDNVDVYNTESPTPFHVLDIQGRQMNSSAVTLDLIFIGCRDRRIFVFSKFSYEMVKMIEVPESVHCLCSLHDFSQVVAGMSDGHIMIFEVTG